MYHMYFSLISHQRNISCDHALAIVNNIYMKRTVQIFLQDSDFVSFTYGPRSEIPGSHGILFIIFEEHPRCFLFNSTKLTFLPNANGFFFTHSL